MADDVSPKNTMMPFNGDFFGSDGKVRNLDEFISAFSGEQAAPGTPGKSAYEIAVEHGFTGTEAEWLDSLKGKDGESSGGGLFKSVLTFDDLPQPAGDYTGELYFVRENSGGALAFMGVYKYPRGFYAVNESGEWANVPLDLSVAEDAFTLANITDWAAFRGFVKTMNAGDAVLYGGVLYQNATGAITDEAPADDTDNWYAMQGLQGSDGKSAYEIAVENGFTGDEAVWLASLSAGGVQFFTTQAPLNTAPAGSKVNDFVINTGTGTLNIGTVYTRIGQLVKITKLSPFTCVLAGNFGNPTLYTLNYSTVSASGDWKAGDLLIITARENITVGANNMLCCPGDLLRITQLSPFYVSSLGSIRGAVGEGLYDIAISQGFIGTPVDFLESMKSGNGVKGTIMEQGLFPVTLYEKTPGGFRRNDDGTGDYILVATPSGGYNLIPFLNVQR